MTGHIDSFSPEPRSLKVNSDDKIQAIEDALDADVIAFRWQFTTWS